MVAHASFVYAFRFMQIEMHTLPKTVCPCWDSFGQKSCPFWHKPQQKYSIKVASFALLDNNIYQVAINLFLCIFMLPHSSYHFRITMPKKKKGGKKKKGKKPKMIGNETPDQVDVHVPIMLINQPDKKTQAYN